MKVKKNIWFNLEPVPGIQNVANVNIKIAIVEHSPSNSDPHPPKNFVQAICSPKQNPAEGEVVKKTLQAEKVPAPPSLF